MSEPFTGHKQATRFLKILEDMGSESQQSFRKIYAQASKEAQTHPSASVGRHVRTAMMEALQHPQIAYWVRMNLAIRVARKFCQVTGQANKLQRLEALLEDFHVASEAFIQKLPIETVARRRRLKQRQALLERPDGLPVEHPVAGLTLPELSPSQISPNISDEELDQILQFKQRIIPGFVKGMRQKQQASF